MEKAKIKIEYSEMDEKSTEELLILKKKLQLHNLSLKNKARKGIQGFHPPEIRRNIARINQILNERNKDGSKNN